MYLYGFQHGSSDMVISPFTKLIASIVLLAVAFAGGLYLGRGQKEVVTVEKRGEERLVYKDRIVTVTRIVKPDGTVTEETRTEDREGTRSNSTVDRSTASKSQSRYRLGVKYWKDYSDPLNFQPSKDIEGIAGLRLFGPVHLELGVRKDSAAVGLSLEF
jgi:hypothetical protein